ncbi:hypothetical protein MKX01_025742 [Papaver californicum]|nr:hypothetical protein MKX01_025742 [Papaver californicum]
MRRHSKGQRGVRTSPAPLCLPVLKTENRLQTGLHCAIRLHCGEHLILLVCFLYLRIPSIDEDLLCSIGIIIKFKDNSSSKYH